MASRKNGSRAPKVAASVAAPSSPVESKVETTAEPVADLATPFIGQWNRLVSTTNWEKGRIICQWREALEAAGDAASAYSDEAWAQLVGGVTSQHVGRLRRTFQKFGTIFDQYEGLYWSHFQASLDWEDAEMWLEGAIHNGWSVSQMRGKRWETLGIPGEPPAMDAAPESLGELTEDAASGAEPAAEKYVAPPTNRKSSDQPSKSAAGEPASAGGSEPAPIKPAPKSRSRLAVEVDDLPADLADAFEQFKLAIIAHRRDRWTRSTPEAVLECLDALRDLALAPADD